MRKLTKDDLLNADVSEIRNNLHPDNYFFSPGAMRFFGDTIKSFGLITIESRRYLYRKPSAMINVFGDKKRAGKEGFKAWEVVITNFDANYNIELVDSMSQAFIYELVRSA